MQALKINSFVAIRSVEDPKTHSLGKITIGTISETSIKKISPENTSKRLKQRKSGSQNGKIKQDGGDVLNASRRFSFPPSNVKYATTLARLIDAPHVKGYARRPLQ